MLEKQGFFEDLIKKASAEKIVKAPANLSEFYSWVDKSIEIRLGI